MFHYYTQSVQPPSTSSCGGRVVKAMDLKSIRVSLRRFESCPQRSFSLSFLLSFSPFFTHLLREVVNLLIDEDKFLYSSSRSTARS